MATAAAQVQATIFHLRLHSYPLSIHSLHCSGQDGIPKMKHVTWQYHDTLLLKLANGGSTTTYDGGDHTTMCIQQNP